MIVRPSFGDTLDLTGSDLLNPSDENYVSTDASIAIPTGTATAAMPTPSPIELLPPTLTPVAPGLSTSDLVPPAGQISVTSDGNIINSDGQILGIVDSATGVVKGEPGVTLSTLPTGTVLNATGLAANVAKAVSNMFGTKTVTATPTASSLASKPLIPGVPNKYLAIGASAFLVVLLASSGGRRR